MQDGSATRKNARGSYRSGEETRQRLIDVALGLFGARGYDATSTREIAVKTGVALPAIAYHFGNKEGLHRACAEYVVERYRTRMRSGVEATQAAMPKAPDQARAALRQIVSLLATMLLDEAEDDGWMTFMLREMNGAGAAHDLLYRDLWAPGLGLVADLIATCHTHAETDHGDRLEALLILSSLTAFSTARQVALEFGGWSTIDPVLIARISDRLGAWIDQL